VDTPHILNEIVTAERINVERLKSEVPVSELQKRIDSQEAPLNLAGALMGDSIRIIAEVKKASPAKGLLRQNFDPVSLANCYVDSGASAISVLTNQDYFQGSIDHLDAVHNAVSMKRVPILRKEFIFDPYQLYEARAYGADAVLLIVAMLPQRTLEDLMEISRELWMQCLVEIHDENELKIASESGAEIVGINNRDLRTFVTDIEVTERLAPLVPEGKIIVSESGVSSKNDIGKALAAGAHAVLIGEALVTADDPGLVLRNLV